jgi:hypothetical protein
MNRAAPLAVAAFCAGVADLLEDPNGGPLAASFVLRRVDQTLRAIVAAGDRADRDSRREEAHWRADFDRRARLKRRNRKRT